MTIVATQPNLSALISAISNDRTLPKSERIYRCSGLRTFARCIGILPQLIPVSAAYFRHHARALTSAKTRLSQQRLLSVKSQLSFALRYSCNGEGRRSCATDISPEFMELLAVLNNKWEKISLARFFSFCSRHGIRPDRVNNDVLYSHKEYLLNHTLVRDPGRNIWLIEKVWNSHSGAHSSWPTQCLSVANRRRHWGLLNDVVNEEIDAYRQFLIGMVAHPITGEFIGRPLATSSVLNHIRTIRKYARAAQSQGFPTQSIVELLSVVPIVAPKTADTGAQGEVTAAYLHSQMLEFRLVAKRWTLTDEPLSPDRTGTSVNPNRRNSPKKFRQIYALLEAGVLGGLLDLPVQLMALAVGHGRAQRTRALAQSAVALEIMLMLPIAPYQLFYLQVGKTLIDDGASGGKIVILAQRQNGLPENMLYELPERSLALLRTYQSFFPETQQCGAWLFHSASCRRRCASAFSRTIVRQISQHLGIELTPRTLRFLGVTLYLLRFPHDYETVRQAMGYRSIAYARRVFKFVRAVRSSALFDKTLTTEGPIPSILICEPSVPNRPPQFSQPRFESPPVRGHARPVLRQRDHGAL